MFAAALGACAPADPPERLLVVQRAEDGAYALGPRVLPGFDAVHASGPLGDTFRGGRVRVDRYHEGAPVVVDWTEADGAAAPLDTDGLLIWSFWAHLADAQADLAAAGVDPAPLQPVNLAITPASALDALAVTNAAWATGLRTFVLLPDAGTAVPLAANAGVVRHEFGHAVFELLVTGLAPGAWNELPTADVLRIRALNEGFADVLATLELDDPRFIDASLVLPERDVAGDAVASSGLYPADDIGVFDTLLYDPYALGTVFASLAWDLRLASDPDTVLALVLPVTAAWADRGDWGDIDAWAVDLVDAASDSGDPALADAACAAMARRFPDAVARSGCP